MPTDWLTHESALAQRWSVLVRIEGVGDYDGQWTFCSSLPTYADGSYYDYLATMPDLLSEQVDRLGGIPEPSAATVEVVDVGDLLTSLLQLDLPPKTVLGTPINAATTSVPVGSDTSIPGSSVIWVGSEALRVVGKASSTLTVTRGWLGTDAVSHEIEERVYLQPQYLAGRRMEISVVPLDASSADEERLVGAYVIESVSWDEAANVWAISAAGQLRYLQRYVPQKPRRTVVHAVYQLSRPLVVQVAGTDVGPLWSFKPFHVSLQDGEEVTPVTQINGGCPLAWTNAPDGSDRAILGTQIVEVKVGDEARQVFVTGVVDDENDFRYSPGPTPATSRSNLVNWETTTHWVDILLILLTSSAHPDDGLELVNVGTGDTDWSKSNFSSLPAGYGVGLPASLIDWESFEDVRNRTSAYVFPHFIYGTEGEPFFDLITREFLRPMGAYLTIEDGTVGIVLPRIPAVGATPAESTSDSPVLVSQDGTGVYLPRLTMQREAGSLIGSVVYKVGRGALAHETTFNSDTFKSLYGQRGFYGATVPSVELEVPSGDPDISELFASRAAASLFRYQRPPQVFSADVDMRLFEGATPGAVLQVSIPGHVSMTSATRGIADRKAEVWERELRFDPDGAGAYVRLTAALYSARVGWVCPAAHVASVSDSTATVTTSRYTYPDSGASDLPATDAAAFAVGDIVLLRDLDGSRVGGDTQEILSISGDDIELDGTFSGALAADTVITYADYADVTATQTASWVFFADLDDQDIGTTGIAAWLWGES